MVGRSKIQDLLDSGDRLGRGGLDLPSGESSYVSPADSVVSASALLHIPALAPNKRSHLACA